MDKAEILRQMSKFDKARHNLLLVVIFSTINLILYVAEVDYYLLFSATAPMLSYGVGWDLAYEFHDDNFLVAGLVIAAVIILLYLACWALAKRRRGFIIAAFVLFMFDCLIYAYLLVDILSYGEFVASELIDIVFHIWILIAMISGLMAWKKLRGINTDEIKSESDDISASKNMEE